VRTRAMVRAAALVAMLEGLRGCGRSKPSTYG
jgi:hypothetical protein